MNKYLKNLNRLEFLITLACTGRCKHCSEGEHTGSGCHIDGDTAAKAVRELCGGFEITSIMTFGGEPLLYPDAVCKIHSAARDMGIPKRQLITNGFFSKETDKIRNVAKDIAVSGVNAVLLSVDAFHQETIPLDTVRLFAEAVKAQGVWIRTNPAWLVDVDADNPYNIKTREILAEFDKMGIERANGNIIFPSGNALKYLGEYFPDGSEQKNPYEENPEDIRAVSVCPNGDVLNGNLYKSCILDIIESYSPSESLKIS